MQPNRQEQRQTGRARAADFERDGYLFPVTVMSEDAAAGYRAQLETIERRHADDPDRLKVLRRYSNIVLPFVDEIARMPGVTDPVAGILGPDLLALDCSFFIKEANTPNFVSLHQDLHYWGLEGEDEVTAWVALSPATVESGCMRFLPGTHRESIDHVDTFDEKNLLTRGQELAVDVDESAAADVVLRPGQMSLHHGRVVHGSNANRSNDRRIGLAIRYIPTSMRQAPGGSMCAMLVRGEDRHGHFDLVDPPSGLMTEADLARHERIANARNSVMFKGAETG